MMTTSDTPYAEMPDLLATVSWFHADGNYYRTRNYYTQTTPLTHHSTHTSIVRKTDEDYQNCKMFVEANNYYMTGYPEEIICPYCSGQGEYPDGDGPNIRCTKCKGTGMLEED